MRSPIKLDLYGDRAVEFYDWITYVGQDFTGATFAAQVRTVPDSPSNLITPVVTLTYGGTATVSAHVAAGRLPFAIYSAINPATNAKYQMTDSLALSVLQIHIFSTSMVAPSVPAAAETGDDVTLAWDMLITPSGGTKDKYFYGSFIVRGTVSQ